MSETVAQWLDRLRNDYEDLDVLPPASAEALSAAECEVGQLPGELREMLSVSNGLACRSFRLLSAFESHNPKKTWECVQRANRVDQTDALGGDPGLLKRFLVFSYIGNGWACIDRTDGSVWYEDRSKEDTSLERLTLGLREFVETMVRNAE